MSHSLETRSGGRCLPWFSQWSLSEPEHKLKRNSETVTKCDRNRPMRHILAATRFERNALFRALRSSRCRQIHLFAE